MTVRLREVEMHPLDKQLRNQLERTVKDARDNAESAARSVLEQLGVGEASAPVYLSEEQREVRRTLRIHGRQLGDALEQKRQEIDRLVAEVAYEHWHRMLFARFLAENNLLMYPDPVDPVAITLDECDDLAADEGAKNGWELASRYAARMLPQIFRPDSPVFKIELPPEYEHKLEQLVDDLPRDVFTASDSIGWVYQFWQSKRKEEINASEVKIGARELPAVTQLFTESYMVSFLLDNSLGAWWAARQLSDDDLSTAKTEAQLREKVSRKDLPLEYLRFIQGDSGKWMPAAGTFDMWPRDLSEFKTIDPCCGSGHFLVAAFLMLVPMRIELEGLSARDAVDRVLAENIHGLELDQRCVELAAFALALAAWRYPDAGGFRVLPELSVACSGLSVGSAKEEWKQLALGKSNLRIALEWMHDTFRDAPVLGSLLDPAKTDSAKLVTWEELSTALKEALSSEQTDEQKEVAVVAQGLAKAAILLAGKYNWVITNVPYLARGKQVACLRDFSESRHTSAKNDLATVFLDRCLELCVGGGTTSIVLPQNWLFLGGYKTFRKRLLTNDRWHLIARLGPGAFETISGEVVKAILISLSRGNQPAREYETRTNDLFATAAVKQVVAPALIRGIDVSEFRTVVEKALALTSGEIKTIEQAKQLENPDARVALDDICFAKTLGDYCSSIEGLTTGDLERFVGKFWEGGFSGGWEPYIQNVDSTTYYGGRSDRILWENGKGVLSKFPTAHNFPSEFMNGKRILGKDGLRITQMGNLPITIYSGEVFGKNAATVVPDALAHLPAIWCFCSSPEYGEAVRQIDQSLKVTNATLARVGFDLDEWMTYAREKYPNGLPRPYTDDPTQWLFHGHPTRCEHRLQAAVARLLGYKWPMETNEEIHLSDEGRTLVKESRTLASHADEDGIVCVPPVRGEASAADRLHDLLATAYGDAWNNDKLAELLTEADHTGKSLDSWLRDKFFTQHCKIFHDRPFIWHIWDGLRDGFSALVNYHKLDTKLLETLIFTYLGDWMSRQKQDINKGVDGAEEKLAVAEQLKKRLELILQGEEPHDIFVRWKSIERQPIGWEPDLNDGVRLNIRPFMSVNDISKKGAGVLRDKPNINWNKDRGKDVSSAPWYQLFKGDRINDHHLSLAEKQSARKAKGKEPK